MKQSKTRVASLLERSVPKVRILHAFRKCRRVAETRDTHRGAAMELPDDWYEDHDGQSRVLNAGKVGAEIERLRAELDRVRKHCEEFHSERGPHE